MAAVLSDLHQSLLFQSLRRRVNRLFPQTPLAPPSRQRAFLPTFGLNAA
jgi:hypothetical protein